MVDVNVDFVLEPDVTYTADIKAETGTNDHSRLSNRDIPNQHPMSAITGLESALEGKQDTLTAGDNIQIEDGVISATDTTYTAGDGISIENGVISNTQTSAEWGNITGTLSDQTDLNNALGDLSGGIESNHQAISNHVSDKNNPHEVTKAQVGLGNVDNTSDLNKPISTATQTALNGKVDKVSVANKVYGTDSDGTQTTYDVGSFGQVDDVQVGGVSVVTNKIAELGTMAGETASDYSTTAQADLKYATASQGALADTALQPNDNITELTNNAGFITIASVPTAVSQLTNDSNYQTGTQVANSIAVETANRESADNNLQSQIDAIVSSSDVFDIVGTYAELQAYDISTVPVNDIIKVLVDSTHDGAATYYRCVETGGVKSWSYIGSEGAYYTKGEADGLFVPQTRTVNNKALSDNITLTASDVGALPSSTVIPVVNDSTVNIQTNGSTVGTFTLNQSSNETVNISVPTKTSDITNDSGYITSADLPTNYVTTDTAQNITAVKTFFGEKAILFKQNATTNKLGFTLYDPSSNEIGAFEFRPSTIGGGALLNLNMSYSSSNWVGFRYWGTAVNIIAPKVATAGNYYIPVNITDGTNTVTASSVGTVNISTLIPSPVTYSAGTGISINSSNQISVTSPTLINRASGTNSITIGNYDTTNNNSIQIGGENVQISDYSVGIGVKCFIDMAPESTLVGYNASTTSEKCTAIGANTEVGWYDYDDGDNPCPKCVAIGYNAKAWESEYDIQGQNYGYCTAIGSDAISRAKCAIQLGPGENRERKSFYVATSFESGHNYKMLGDDGKIPSGRLPIATSVSSSSTNDETVGAKVFYDTCGDIETLINAL